MKRLHIPLLAIMAVMAVSCYPVVERVPLMAYQKQMIPYQKGKEVRFTDAKGETTLFTTTNISTEWNWDETAITKYWLQRYTVILQSESGDQVNLHVGSFSFDYYGIDYYNKVNITLRNLEFSLPFDCAGKFYTHAEYDTKWHVFDTLSINNKVYYDVVLQENDKNQLYYNKTYGILQLRQNGQDILTLQK